MIEEGGTTIGSATTRVATTRIFIFKNVAPGFKDKTRYILYVSPGSQIPHIATNKDNIKRQYLLHNILVKENNLRVKTAES